MQKLFLYFYQQRLYKKKENIFYISLYMNNFFPQMVQIK